MICTKNMCIYRIFLKQSNYFLIWQQVKHVVCVTVFYPYIIFSKMANKLNHLILHFIEFTQVYFTWVLILIL